MRVESAPTVVTYQFGPYRLAPDQRRLERDGHPVALTPKAFDLLVALVRHRERALSKDEILALVWPGAMVEEGNLSQQVLLLRRALGDHGDAVATLPRHGYRFVTPVAEVIDAGAVRGLMASRHCLQWNGGEFALREGLTVVGRAADADLSIPLPSVSRHHARFVVSGDECTLEDLGSRHGSWREGVVVRGPARLWSGDQLRLGTAVVVYTMVTSDDTTFS